MANPDFTGVLSSDRSSFEGELPGSIHFGIQGPPGPPGKDGTVAFEDLTAEQIESLRGRPGPSGKTAYEYALDGGYTGSETDFVTKLTTEYLPLSGGDMTGELKMNGHPISGLNDPTANDHAANRGFVNKQVRKAAPRNLLDNSDFRNPVNQRNAGGSYPTWGGYTIDRWAIGSKVTNLTLFPGESIGLSGDGAIFQRVANPQNYANKTLTAVAKIYGHTFICSGKVTFNNSWARIAEHVANDTRLDILVQDDNSLWVSIDNFGVNETYLEWAALYEGEYTIDTLPEYQPKGYAVELAECRRYYRKYEAITLTPWVYEGTSKRHYRLNFDTPMRIAPAVDVSQIFEKQLWTTLSSYFDVYRTDMHGVVFAAISDIVDQNNCYVDGKLSINAEL